MYGFGGTRQWADVRDKAGDIEPLLNHSDCDGELGPDECSRVAKALRAAVSTWSDDDYDKKNALELAEGMDNAAASRQHLLFQ